MATNNQLKAYVRLDASNRVVSGSVVLRRKKPVTGRWREIEADACCSPNVLLSTTPADVTLATIVFTLTCDATDVAVNTITPETATSNIDDVVAALNKLLDFYGHFSVGADGTSVDLKLKLDIAQALCGDVTTLSFTLT